ncbi:MAG: KH domain-containing protein [Candidatus Bilamarchaeaceae archaeon]
MEIVKIPEERIAVIIGEGGKVKKMIEEKAQVQLLIEEASVMITGEGQHVFFAKDVVKAIGRGFNPDTALKIITEDMELKVINLKEFEDSDSGLTRVKGRIIGEGGSVKKEIESATESFVCIYGHTVSIISKYDSIQYAIEAVMKLIHGAKHTTVLTYLAKAKRDLVSARLGAGSGGIRI